ncbi:hypothetical protein J4526_00525 [Desulfurococcaceae archaeon MEX13E-LK6-19]|nr:hypothetical protein J4526_00525 [Desulfurococcaceae archaeon MEX13E-LK6-19]
MEQPSNVSEYWFLRYYRVLIIEENGKKTVSVDVYKKGFVHKITSEKCLENKEYCILYSEIDKKDYLKILGEDLANKIEKTIVVGVKAKNKTETVNVRYIINGELTYNDIERLFYKSWEIIGCNAPREEELP